MGLTESDIRRVVWTFAQSFIAAVVVFASGWAVFPNWSAVKAAALAGLLAGLAAAASLIKNLVLDDGSTLK